MASGLFFVYVSAEIFLLLAVVWLVLLYGSSFVALYGQCLVFRKIPAF